MTSIGTSPTRNRRAEVKKGVVDEKVRKIDKISRPVGAEVRKLSIFIYRSVIGC